MYWIVGAGNMSKAYVSVFKSLEIPFLVIGRGKESAEKLSRETGVPVISGGVEDYMRRCGSKPDGAIIATGSKDLPGTTIALLDHGVRKILVEKPLCYFNDELEGIKAASLKAGAKIFVAYNRRYYESVGRAREIAAADGGVTSFHFEFTEWAHVIEKLEAGRMEKAHTVIGNSSHVIDLAFHLGGMPIEIETRRSGSLSWHPSGAVFVGSGVAAGGALFSYQANWNAPGRWGLELLTQRHRLILRPLESLQIQEKGSLEINPVGFTEPLEQQFKPGLYRQVKAFVDGDTAFLCGLEEFSRLFPIYCKIAGY